MGRKTNSVILPVVVASLAGCPSPVRYVDISTEDFDVVPAGMRDPIDHRAKRDARRLVNLLINDQPEREVSWVLEGVSVKRKGDELKLYDSGRTIEFDVGTIGNEISGIKMALNDKLYYDFGADGNLDYLRPDLFEGYFCATGVTRNEINKREEMRRKVLRESNGLYRKNIKKAIGVLKDQPR